MDTRAAVATVVSAFSGTTPRRGRVRVLALDGPSGSGKTTLAAGLMKALGLTTAQVVPMDRIYPGWDGLAAAVDLVTDRVLAPLAAGERASYPVWDWARERWGGCVAVPPTEVLLLEGCGSAVGRAGTYAAMRVWVEAPEEVRHARAMARDGDLFRPHWRRWQRQEHALYDADDTRAKADLILATGHDRAARGVGPCSRPL